jgi:hypothetical protein
MNSGFIISGQQRSPTVKTNVLSFGANRKANKVKTVQKEIADAH